jgi:molybdopterin biosynthesis enzyme MoaB
MFKAAVLTVSDRSSQGQRPDTAGPLVAELLQAAGYEVSKTLIVPDEGPRIEAILRQWSDEGWQI